MQAELNVPAASPAPAARPSRSRFAFVKTILKTLYIIAATAVSLLVVSFTPEQGGSLVNFPISTSSLAVHVPDPRALHDYLKQNPALQSALTDEDIRGVLPLAEKRDELLARLKEMPPVLQRIIAPTPEGILPWLGREWLLTLQTGENDRKPPGVLYVRVSGGRGHAVRLALFFAALKRRTAVTDLGGGVLAVSINKGDPLATSQTQIRHAWHAAPSTALIQGWLKPREISALTRSKQTQPLPEMLVDVGLPQSILDALQQPPAMVEIFRLNRVPDEVDFKLSPGDGGGLAFDAELRGASIAPSAVVTQPAAELTEARAAGVLPVDMRMLFLWYLEQQMRPKKGVAGLTRTQRRWLTRFEHLTALGIDLDRDLWPAFGQSVRFAVRPSPPELSTQYGILSAQLPFNASHPHARKALGEFARERWEHLFDGAPPKAAKPPFVRRIRGENVERYVLATGHIAAPAWTVYAQHIDFESDAGAFALRQPELPAAPNVRLQATAEYYLRADGAQLAPMAEAYATLHFDELEEELGTGEFLERYPDAAAQIRATGKLTRAAGKITLNAQPRQPDSIDLRLVWTPSPIAAHEATGDSPAPPPAK